MTSKARLPSPHLAMHCLDFAKPSRKKYRVVLLFLLNIESQQESDSTLLTRVYIPLVSRCRQVIEESTNNFATRNRP